MRSLLCWLFLLPAAVPAVQNAGSAGAPQDVKERDLKIRRTTPAKTPSVLVPRGFALVIGIGKYKNLPSGDALEFSESDAQSIYRVLISPDAGAFPPENVHVLIGPQATLANIRKELEVWLPTVALPQDRVVVYFAGHGLVANGRGYLAPYDVNLSDLNNTAYPMARLGKVLSEDVKAYQKILLTDACHSGKITPESTQENVDAQLSGLPRSFLTLTATTEREQSYEDPKLSTGFGVFTYFLVQGWQGNADTDPCDGKITTDELVSYVQREVRRYARERHLYQSPTAHGDFDPALVLGVSRGCKGGGESEISSVGTLIVQSNMDDVELYLDDKLVGKVQKASPLPLPGLAAGVHTVKGVRKGYEPDIKQVTILPGQQNSVIIRIHYPIETKRSAVELLERGEKLLFSHRSMFNPLSVYAPRSQSAGDLKQARDLFTQALKEDPKYAKAAYYLGVVSVLLSDNHSLEYFKRAVEIDPSYIDARLDYSGALIENGDPDEAIRQLTEVLRLDPKADEAYSHMARAYLDKEVWDLCVRNAAKAIQLRPENEQAYLWKADASRHLAAIEKDPARKKQIYGQASADYQSFLERTNFSSPVYQKLLFYGFGLSRRGHADRKGSYNAQRSMAFLGLCDCEQHVGNLMRAAEYCSRGLRYSPDDPIGYYILGNVYRDLFNQYKRRDYLVSARQNYAKTIALNPDLEDTRFAKDYLEQIDRLLQLVRN